MRTVYVVVKDTWSPLQQEYVNHHIRKIFSTRKGADEFIAKHPPGPMARRVIKAWVVNEEKN